MTQLQEVHVAPEPIGRFRPLLGADAIREAEAIGDGARSRLTGRVIWNVNSTARGGRVAEMLLSLPAYARGAGAARWLVIGCLPTSGWMPRLRPLRMTPH